MKIIVISDSKKINNETAVISNLFENGLQTFHLRKYNISTRSMRKIIDAIPEQYHNRIMLHSHHDLIYHYKLMGIHFTENHLDRKLNTWLSLKRIKFRIQPTSISCSFNSLGSIQEEKKIDYDYVFLSPVFDSIKSKFQSGFPEYGLKMALSKSKYHVIARGGINAETIEKAYHLGFFGAALHSAIWDSKNPVHEFDGMMSKLLQLNIPIK